MKLFWSLCGVLCNILCGVTRFLMCVGLGSSRHCLYQIWVCCLFHNTLDWCLCRDWNYSNSWLSTRAFFLGEGDGLSASFFLAWKSSICFLLLRRTEIIFVWENRCLCIEVELNVKLFIRLKCCSSDGGVFWFRIVLL